MVTGTTLMDDNKQDALERGQSGQGPDEAREATLIPMLVWGLVLIIIGMIFAVMVS